MLTDFRTEIYFDNDDETLTFSEVSRQMGTPNSLATREQYEACDRVSDSIFDLLCPQERVRLSDGHYVLDDELDLIIDE